ncbi:MAG TPA: hypothetical protein VGB17_04005 [Pyrinomonadaceae bacterium]|jgi:hypothetical protein
MAEERDVTLARVTDDDDDAEPSKAELQRRMEEARESISQTVAEIKDTVVHQYNAVKETLDWREQYRRRPIAWSVGALGVGFIVGYSLTGALIGESDDDEDEYSSLSAEDSRVFQLPPSSLERAAPTPQRAYAGQAITGSAYGSSMTGSTGPNYEASEQGASASYDWSGSASNAQAEAEEPQGPGMIERFKQTKAYDRLQEEVSTIGDRFLEELSKTAQTVVLPALFNKIKDLLGVDLSGKRQGQAGTGTTTASAASASGGAQTAAAGSGQGGSQASGSSYGTSENRGYGASA